MKKILGKLKILGFVLLGVLLANIPLSSNNKIAELSQCIDDKKPSAQKIEISPEETVYFMGCGGFF
ncbi:MAG: hypothetical protein HYT93_00040 [Parcubacteria group bacterium]|nr:hypothetical protein [Parcubacteria group bacterium]